LISAGFISYLHVNGVAGIITGLSDVYGSPKDEAGSLVAS